MSAAEILDVRSDSRESFDDAIHRGIERARAASPAERVRGAWVDGRKLEVENGAVTAYHVDMRVAIIIR